MTAIRDNLNSPFTFVSEIYVVALMFLCFYAACVWIPYQINEYQVPIYFRSTYSNVFYDFLKLRIFFFGYFMVLSGCLPQLIFYDMSSDQKCLHTKNVTHCFPRVGGCVGVDVVQVDTR